VSEPSSIEPDADVLKELVALQDQTPCRKCKATSWTLLPARREAKGGDRVGIYVVLGRADERVCVIAFQCKACSAPWERPCYSRAQLARQQYPAVKLDVRASDAPAKPDGPAGQNGQQKKP